MNETVNKFIEKKGFTWLRAVGVILFVLSVLFIVLFRKWLFTNPFEPYPLSDISYISRQSDGEMLITTSSGNEILKVSSDGILKEKYVSGKNSFEGATFSVIGGDGKLYVYGLKYYKGVRIASEKLFRLNSDGTLDKIIDNKKNNYVNLLSKLEVLNPVTTLKRGYSVTRVGDKIVSKIDDIKTNDTIITSVSDGKIESIVKNVYK